MSSTDAQGPRDENDQKTRPARELNKAAAMREAVRQVIESLLEKKPEKGPKPSLVIVAALLGLVSVIGHLQ